MKNYLLTSKLIEGEGVFFGYNDVGLLVRFDATGKIGLSQITWLHENMPLKYSDLPAFKQKVEANKHNNAKITEVQADLSFIMFWETYNYKVGKKDKAKQIWEGMTEASRVTALEYIKKYNRWLSDHINVEKQYPTTYLNTKQWEN